MLHVREQEGVRRARMMRVMNDKVAFGDAVAELHDFDVAIGLAANALVAVLAIDQRLAMLELEDVLASCILFREREPGAVIEDIAILQNFNEIRAPVRGGMP